jgi:HPt (histidine-containing phosphotransfer) domain-containing protein
MLLEVFGLDRHELHTMLTIVVQDLGRYLLELETAISSGDFDEIGRSAHRLRGPSSAVLAWDACEAASAVEEAARCADSGLVQAALENLRRLHEELVRALKDFDQGSAL